MNSLRFSRKVALRYLWSKRSEAFITIITVISILGVAIGVMVLNIVMGVMTGFEDELKRRLTETNSHIVVSAVGGFLRDWEQVSESVRKVPGVESVSPYTQSQALVRTRDRSSGLLIRGVKPGTPAADQVAHYLRDNGQGATLFDPLEVEVPNAEGGAEAAKLPPLYVGRELALRMRLFKGMPVSILSPQVSSSPFGLVPRFRRFAVAGIYNSGLVEYESGLAYTSLDEAQKFFNFEGTVSGLEVNVQDVNQAGAISKEILDSLGGFASGLYAQDWTETNRPLWDALRLEKRVYFIVLLLIVLMASFSIVTTLIMLVLEKRKDIAIMRTLGASSRAVGLIFFIQGAVIGALGTVSGLIAGFLGSVALREYGFPLDERIFQMSTVPVKIEPVNFLAVGIAAFLICCLSLIYPAFRASHLEPSEVLRYE